MAVSTTQRQAVITRAQNRCEYCQTQGRIVIWMEVEHIIPRALGGTDDLDNLCLSCAVCNRHKSNYITGLDPETGLETPLFNPRQQVWAEHFQWGADKITLIGLTPIGRATIARLNINLDEVIIARRNWVSVGWHPPPD